MYFPVLLHGGENRILTRTGKAASTEIKYIKRVIGVGRVDTRKNWHISKELRVKSMKESLQGKKLM